MRDIHESFRGDPKYRHVKLIGGPLNGVVHEVQGFKQSKEICIESFSGFRMFWYRVDGETAEYVRTTQRVG